jgi:hypothetical protein
VQISAVGAAGEAGWSNAADIIALWTQSSADKRERAGKNSRFFFFRSSERMGKDQGSR